MSTGVTELIQEEGAGGFGGASPSGGGIPDIAARSPLQLFWRRLKEDRVAMVALGVIVLLIVVAILAPLIVKLMGLPKPSVQNSAELDEFGSAAGPSAAHPMGIDDLGRDIMSRVLYGARVSLAVAIIATGLSMLIGVTLGLFAGFYRGWVDTLVSRAMDVILAFPVLLLAIGIGRACVGRRAASAACSSRAWRRCIIVIVIPTLPVHRAHRARPGPVAPRARVRRGVAIARRVRTADHVPRDPAEPGRAR